MDDDNLVGLGMCLALEPPPGGAWIEASGESILAAGLEAGFGFECAIGITGPQGAYEASRPEFGFEPDGTRFMEDLESPTPFAVFEKPAQEETAIRVSNRDRSGQHRADVVAVDPACAARVELPIGWATRARRAAFADYVAAVRLGRRDRGMQGDRPDDDPETGDRRSGRRDGLTLSGRAVQQGRRESSHWP